MSTATIFATPFQPKSKIRRPAQWSEIKLLLDASPWILGCVTKISEFSRLPANWDGYGSNPMSKDAIRAALRFLSEAPLQIISEPSVSPVAGGGLGFHWRVENRDLELEFLADGTVEYLKTSLVEGEEIKPQEGTIRDLGDSRLWRWLSGELA